MNPDEIRASLGKLRSQSRIGGASDFYELNSPLPESEILAFEARHRVRLPEDFRAFLRDAGNGGVGPFFGVFSLGYSVGDGACEEVYYWDGVPDDVGVVGVLERPFPYSNAWNLASDAFEPPPRPPGREPLTIHPFTRQPLSEEAAWRLEWEREVWDGYMSARHIDGALPLCHEGCHLFDYLVITGPCAGQVWHDARSEEMGLYPWIGSDGVRMTFARWYAAWLEASLSGREFSREPFVALDLPGPSAVGA